MRYRIFNDRDGSEPVISAPWRWLAFHLVSLLSLKWDWCRVVDSKTRGTVMEWGRGSRSPAGPAIYPQRSVGVIRAVKAACAAVAIKMASQKSEK
jgi:hypothetical protein